MQFRQRLQEDDAVSPVIGVILMVAITVILAAVIASFVLGLGPDTATTPTASFNSDYDSTNHILEVTMSSGDTIDAQKISFEGDVDTGNGHIDGDGYIDSSDHSELTAGSTVEVHLTGSAGDPYTVTMVYNDGDTTSTMQTFEN